MVELGDISRRNLNDRGTILHHRFSDEDQFLAVEDFVQNMVSLITHIQCKNAEDLRVKVEILPITFTWRSFTFDVQGIKNGILCSKLIVCHYLQPIKTSLLNDRRLGNIQLKGTLDVSLRVLKPLQYKCEIQIRDNYGTQAIYH